MENSNKNTSIARIENNFIFQAEYYLTARQQKVMLFLISKINPNESDFHTQKISLKELENVIMTKRSGSFYQEMQEFSLSISQKQIIYDSNIGLKKKPIKGVINWFQSITPAYNDKGEVCLEFSFSEKLKPFLLELKEYAQIDYKDVLPLGSGYSIRLYKIFRAYRDKMQKHQYRSKLKYSLEEFRSVLAITDKYPDWRKLNRMLGKTLTEINELTPISVELHLERKGRKVVGLEFEFWDKEGRGKKNRKAGDSTGRQREGLTFAQEKALERLVEYGVTEGIAKQMIAKELGSEVQGFEDWYFEACIRVVEQKSTAQGDGTKPGVLVNWFLKLKVFEQGDHFAKIMEQLAARKKKLEREQPDAWGNRLAARGMTAGEFRDRVKGK